MKSLVRLLLVAICGLFTLDIVSSRATSRFFKRGGRALQEVPSQSALCPRQQISGLSVAQQMTLSPLLQQRVSGLQLKKISPIMPLTPSFISQAQALTMMQQCRANYQNIFASPFLQKRSYSTEGESEPQKAQIPKETYQEIYQDVVQSQLEKITAPTFLKTGTVRLEDVMQSIPDGEKVLRELLSNMFGKEITSSRTEAYRQLKALYAIARYVSGGPVDVRSPFEKPLTLKNVMNINKWSIDPALFEIDLSKIENEIYHMKLLPVIKQGWIWKYTEKASLADADSSGFILILGKDSSVLNSVILNSLAEKRTEQVKKLIAFKRKQTTDPQQLRYLDICEAIVDEIRILAEQDRLQAINERKKSTIDPKIYDMIRDYIEKNYYTGLINPVFDAGMTEKIITAQQKEEIKKYVQVLDQIAQEWAHEVEFLLREGSRDTASKASLERQRKIDSTKRPQFSKEEVYGALDLSSDATPRQILGIKEGASKAEIKKAQLTLLKQWHPDVNKKPIATEVFKLISEAGKKLL
ncbi:MAG: DnaJ domain-containing protein [Candidatus Babeliaceae bacterium]|jgi:hypothetical protein